MDIEKLKKVDGKIVHIEEVSQEDLESIQRTLEDEKEELLEQKQQQIDKVDEDIANCEEKIDIIKNLLK